MSLGEVIKDARLKKNIKQAEIAKEVGITVQTYIKWEADETEPKASQVVKLGKVLDLSANEICAGKRSYKMNLPSFMVAFSKIQQQASALELALSVWETVEDDQTFIDSVRKNANLGLRLKDEDVFDPLGLI